MAEIKIYCGRGSALKGREDLPVRVKLSFGDRDRALLEQHKNDKGWVSIIVAKSREPDKFGNTYYATIDTWKPTPSDVTKPAIEHASSEPPMDEPPPF